MALLFMDGFDAGDFALKWTFTGGSTGSTFTRFNSGQCQLVYSSGKTTRSFPASSKVFVGLAIASNLLDATTRPYVSLYGDNGVTQHLTVGISSNAVSLYRGAVNGTLLASYPGVFKVNSWYDLEISATIADVGGTCEVKFNGVSVINYTGDTKNAGTNTTIDAVGICANGNFNAYFDDMYVCNDTGAAPYNTFLGDVRINTLVPIAAGSSTQFTPSTGANYTTVDELPYSASDYVSSGTVGNRDTYTMSDLPASTGTILAVQTNVIARKNDAGSISAKDTLVTAATNYYGSTVIMGPSDQSLTTLYTTNPNTGLSWTQADVNGIEAGVEVA